MTKFAVNDRVGTVADGKLRYYEHGDGPYYGSITDILSDGRVMVRWDNKWMNDRSKPVNPQDLVAESEMQERYSELERAFRKLEVDVRDKMTEASKLILDAKKIAKTAGFSLRDLSEATSILEEAIDTAGWQTSSWHC